MSTQKNVTWQNGSQQVQLMLPSSTPLYYKRFLCSIPISGTFG